MEPRLAMRKEMPRTMNGAPLIMMRFVTVAFEPLDETVHALEEVSRLRFQGCQAGFVTLHLLGQADFGLRPSGQPSR